jgi:hypothetical protein
MGSSLRWNDGLRPSLAEILLLLSLFHAARTPSTHPDPEGGAQDVRRFPTEPLDGESENPGHVSGRCCSVEQAFPR